MTRALLLLTLVACAPTETGNPVSVALSAHTSDPELVSLGGNGLSIDSVWVGVGDIRFVLAVECDESVDTEVQIPGPLVVDLLGDPMARTFAPSTMEYCRVRVPIEPVEEVPVPAPVGLIGHAIHITGTTAAGVPFVLRSDNEVELDVRTTASPFVIDGALVLSFDVARWFDGVDIDSGVPGGDGTVLIDDANNGELLDAFEDRVEDALELYADDDDDGRRDDGEERLADSELE